MGELTSISDFDGWNPATTEDEGYIVVVKDGEWWHVNDELSRVYPERTFDWAGLFVNDRAVVRENGKFWHIKPDGSDAYEYRFDAVGKFMGDRTFALRDGRWRFIDRQGEDLTEPRKRNIEASDLYVFQAGFASRDDLDDLLDVVTNLYIGPKYDIAITWHLDGFFRIRLIGPTREGRPDLPTCDFGYRISEVVKVIQPRHDLLSHQDQVIERCMESDLWEKDYPDYVDTLRSLK